MKDEPPCATCGHSWAHHHQQVVDVASWPFEDSGTGCLHHLTYKELSRCILRVYKAYINYGVGVCHPPYDNVTSVLTDPQPPYNNPEDALKAYIAQGRFKILKPKPASQLFINLTFPNNALRLYALCPCIEYIPKEPA